MRSEGPKGHAKGARKISRRNALRQAVAPGGTAAATIGVQAARRASAQDKKPVREVFKGTWQETRAFSPLVRVQGGTTLYVAGVGHPRDAAGKPLDFEAQVRGAFEDMRATLARAGASLDDIVTMTVFINDMRNGVRFTEIRRDYFKAGYPASALIGVSAFMDPAMLVEIQSIDVISG